MGKLLAIVSLGRGLYGRWLFQRLVAGVLVTVGLTIVISIMMGALLIGGLYASYCALLYFGLEPQGAMLLTGMLAVAVTGILMLLIMECMQRLRRMPKILLKRSPLTAGAAERAQRRYKQLKEKGVAVNLADLSREIEQRDWQDSTRSAAPLKAASDAVLIDSTARSAADVVEAVWGIGVERGIWR